MNNSLRQQRDRFVAFSFAAADLLIETGAGNRITYASGAAQRLLGVDAQTLVGRPVVEIFSIGDHSMVTSLVLAGAARGRFGPVMVKLAHKSGRPLPAVLNGCRLPGRPDDLYLTLNAASAMHATEALANRRDAETGLLDSSSFARVTAESIKMAQAVGRLIRRGDDKGVFVMLDAAAPTRLFASLPPGCEVQRMGLAEAVELVSGFLPADEAR